MVSARQLLTRSLRGEVSYGAVSGTIVHTDEQTAGRARGPSRTWAADPGSSLLATIILHRSDLPPAPAASLVVGWAAAAAVAEQLSASTSRGADGISLKWPNDIFLDDRKLGGVLVETAGQDWLLAGIGINLTSCPPDETLRTPATFLGAAGCTPNRDDLLSAILTNLHAAAGYTVNRLLDSINGYMRYLNYRVVLHQGKNRIHGRFSGIGPEGEALIEAKGETIHCFSGEMEPDQAAAGSPVSL